MPETSVQPIPEALGRYFAEQSDIEVAYLFGSRAEGRAAEDSDWDFALVTAERSQVFADAIRTWLRQRSQES